METTNYDLTNYRKLVVSVPDPYVIPVYYAQDVKDQNNAIHLALKMGLFKGNPEHSRLTHAEPMTPDDFERMYRKTVILTNTMPESDEMTTAEYRNVLVEFNTVHGHNLWFLAECQEKIRKYNNLMNELDRLESQLLSLCEVDPDISRLITDKIKVSGKLLETAREGINEEISHLKSLPRLKSYEFVYMCTHKEEFTIEAENREEAIGQAQEYINSLSVNAMYQIEASLDIVERDVRNNVASWEGE